MLFAIYLFLICIVFWLCFADYKGIISDKLLCIFMFPLMAFVTTNADKVAYVRLYQQIDSITGIGYTDPGFGLLMYIGNVLGFDYNGFLIFLTIIGLFFIVMVLKKISRCPAIVFACYFVFVFPVYTIQIRSFIAETVLYIMIVEIINREEFDLIKFFILLTLSTLFHASSFFYILLLFVVFIKSSRKLILLVTLSMAAISESYYILSFIPIPMIQEKSQYYLIYRESMSGAVVFLLVAYVFLLGAIYLLTRKTYDKKWRIRMEKLLRINLIGIIACALVLVFNSNFYRIIRVIFIVDIIIMANKYFETYFVSLKKRTVFAGLFIVFFIGHEFVTDTILNLAINNSFLCSFLALM